MSLGVRLENVGGEKMFVANDPGYFRSRPGYVQQEIGLLVFRTYPGGGAVVAVNDRWSTSTWRNGTAVTCAAAPPTHKL